DLAGIESQLNKLRQGTTRIIDSYSEGLIDKQEFEPRIKRLRERIEKLEGQARELSDQAKLQSELDLIMGRLEDFTWRVKDGLDQADWNSRRDIIRALVKRVDVEKGRVNVVFRVDQLPFESSPARGSLQHCRRRTFLVDCQSFAPLRSSSRCDLNSVRSRTHRVRVRAKALTSSSSRSKTAVKGRAASPCLRSP